MISWILEKIDVIHAGGSLRAGGAALGRIRGGQRRPAQRARGQQPWELIAYATAGMRSDHESTTVEEARAKAALGMLAQVREGSSAHSLDALLPLLAGGELDESWRPVTDDIFPNDLRRHGRLDGLLRRVVAGGVRPAVAVWHASYVTAHHYGLPAVPSPRHSARFHFSRCPSSRNCGSPRRESSTFWSNASSNRETGRPITRKSLFRPSVEAIERVICPEQSDSEPGIESGRGDSDDGREAPPRDPPAHDAVTGSASDRRLCSR
jgi:hypothetical protein